MSRLLRLFARQLPNSSAPPGLAPPFPKVSVGIQHAASPFVGPIGFRRSLEPPSLDGASPLARKRYSETASLVLPAHPAVQPKRSVLRAAAVRFLPRAH